MLRLLAIIAISSLLLGCAPTLTLEDGRSFQGHIISHTEETLRVEPAPEHVKRLWLRGLIPEGYRGGPIDIPAERVVDQSQVANASAGLTSAGILLITTSISIASADRRSAIPFLVMPFSATSAALAATFLADWWDQSAGGDPDIRLGLAITGTVLTALFPSLTPFAFFEEADDFGLLYVGNLMPTFFIASVALMSWGWSRHLESEADARLTDILLAPALVPDREGGLSATLNLSFTW